MTRVFIKLYSVLGIGYLVGPRSHANSVQTTILGTLGCLWGLSC